MSATAKHTPGPWRASKGFEGEADRWIVVQDNGGPAYIIAMIHNGAPGDFLDTEEANAHLFAAAPDLYSVLAELMEMRDKCFIPSPEGHWDERALAALAKARAAAASPVADGEAVGR